MGERLELAHDLAWEPGAALAENPVRREGEQACHRDATPGASPSLAFSFESYDYTHVRHEYMVDGDFEVSNVQGATASGGGYASSLYLNAGIPLSSSFGVVTNTFRPVFQDIVAATSPAGDAHGGYNMSGFGGFSKDGLWTRHMVLLREGGLVP